MGETIFQNSSQNSKNGCATNAFQWKSFVLHSAAL
jgi:hypothetical protein